MSSIIFGPINSRRFGRSLGVDLSPKIKQCNFDCLYCELQGAKTLQQQKDVVELETVCKAIDDALKVDSDIDVVTLTANGEPTLYPHLQKLIEFLQSKHCKTMILSNAATINDSAIQDALIQLDCVKLSLDCATQSCFKKLDRPNSGIDIENIKSGMKSFAKRYRGELIIEILFVKTVNDNAKEIEALNRFLKDLSPSRIDIGTIDRPPAYDVKALSYDELFSIAKMFDPNLFINIASRKQTKQKPTAYSTKQIYNTLLKRPLTDDDVKVLFDLNSRKKLDQLCSDGKVVKISRNNLLFYKIAD